MLQRFGIFVLRHQCLRQTVNVRRVVRVLLHGLAVGRFGFRVFFRLRIRVAQQIVDVRRSRFPGRLGQQRYGFLGAPFINQKLAQLLERCSIARIPVHGCAQNLFRLVVLVFEAVEPREPQRGVGIVRLNFQNGLELIDGLVESFLLRVARVHIAQRADVNAREQPVRIHIVGIEFQNFLRLSQCFTGMLRLGVNFRQALHDHGRIRRQGQRFLVGIDGLRG